MYFMTQKQKRNKKWLCWLLMLMLFVAVAGIVYLVWNAYFRGKDERQNTDVITETVEIEKEEEPQRQEEAEVIEKPKVAQYDGEDPNDSDELSGVITYAGVADDYLVVRVNIDQYLRGGECRLTVLSSDSVIHEEVVEIVGGPSSSSCNGFDVPVGIIGSGKFEIVINLESDDKKGAIREEVDV